MTTTSPMSAASQRPSPSGPERPASLPHPPGPAAGAPLDDPADLFPPPHEADAAMGDLLPPQPIERSIVKRVVYLSLGILFLLIGTVLWVTPIIGGAPLFWIPGCILLAKASDPVRRLINRGDRKMPRKVRSLFRWARDKTGAGKGVESPAAEAKTGDTGDSDAAVERRDPPA